MKQETNVETTTFTLLKNFSSSIVLFNKEANEEYREFNAAKEKDAFHPDTTHRFCSFDSLSAAETAVRGFKAVFNMTTSSRTPELACDLETSWCVERDDHMNFVVVMFMYTPSSQEELEDVVELEELDD